MGGYGSYWKFFVVIVKSVFHIVHLSRCWLIVLMNDIGEHILLFVLDCKKLTEFVRRIDFMF